MGKAAAALADLAEEFWAWRTATAPDSHDDLTRVERPPGWRADWSADAIAGRRRMLRIFSERYCGVDLSREPVAVRVDGCLLGSALARVRWELDLVRAWQRNPCFYLDQSLGPAHNLLLPPPPFSSDRATAIVGHLERVPAVLGQARQNLAGHLAAPFARAAMEQLAGLGGQLGTAMAALAPLLPARHAAALPAATRSAAAAAAAFRAWLGGQLPAAAESAATGPESLAFFLHRVALLPYPAERLRAMARQEWNRAVAAEAVLRRRHRGALPAALIPSASEEIARQHRDELGVRRFYAEQGILSQPGTLRHYRFAAMPPYLKPLAWLGPSDDLTSPARAGEDALRYISEPAPGLPYFQRAKALDPRTAIVHEGVHAQQLALSWRHPHPARRRYYDSAPNEGIAFYNEELMLQAGLFDDSPASAEFIVSSQALRALRVEIDIGLALGDLTLQQAAGQLATAVPVDRQTAWEEAVFFAGNPGQGLSYQAGKLQILDLLAAACRRGGAFDLRDFHDRLWREGNVPLALQRWELLGRRDHLEEAERLAAAHAAAEVPQP